VARYGRVRLLSVALFVLPISPPLAAERSTVQQTTDPEIRFQLSQSWTCQPRKTCSKIRSCHEAEWYLHNCSWGGRLDGDSDGAPCENLCGSNN
jgi:hypothetical protein